MTAASPSVLIAGATGYIGRLLAQSLREDGRDVRCLVRDPAKAQDLAAAGCEIVRGDVLEPSTLAPALEGIELAYYLVHSMGRGASGGDFAKRDATAAKNFGGAARAAGVERLVYLGGLGDEDASEHLASRHHTAELLAESGIPLTYFRAAAVIGSGSESFRVVFYLVKRLPAMVTPKWTTTKTQPIAVADVVGYLRAAIETPEADGREIQIGGAEITTYGGMMDAMAAAMDRRAPLRISVPVLSPKLSSLWIGLVTPVDVGVARPLIEGMTTETVVSDRSGMELFEIEPTPLDEGMRAALAE